MSYFTAPGGERVEIFGHGGGRAEAERQGIPFLGEVPLDLAIRSQSDIGQPIVIAQKDAPSSRTLRSIAEKVAAQVSIRNYEAPVLEVE
jgi:ATP-binding protein involved in chromosome partitioning